MHKEVISDRQGIALVTLFIIGTSTVVATGVEAQRDFWLVHIFALIISIPIVLIYAHLHYLYPGKDLIDMLHDCLGKVIGTVIGLLYVWFAFQTGALILKNFSQFIVTVAIQNVPEFVSILLLIVLAVWAVKEGNELLGRWAAFFMPIVLVFLIITIILLIPKMKIDNLLPIFENGIKPVLEGSFSVLTFPFIETVIFMLFFSDLKTPQSPYKIYIIGLLISGMILFIIALTNILVLGVQEVLSSYFPTYSMVARMDIGDLLQRMEVIAAIVYILGGFVKLSVSLLAACKGLSKVMGCTNYRCVVVPLALMMANISIFIFKNPMETIEAIKPYAYYKIPFVIIFPISLLSIAQIKKKRGTLLPK